jgi:choice-of-anchor A domain-containing protein
MRTTIVFATLFTLSFASFLTPGLNYLWNAFVVEDFVCSNSDVEGRLFAGGNVIVSNFAIGCQLYNTNPKTNCIQFGSVNCTQLANAGDFVPSLLVGGELNAINTQVYAGSVIYDGALVTKPFTVNDCGLFSSNIVNNPTYGGLLQQSLAQLRIASTTLLSFAATSVVTSSYGTLVFSGTGANVEVFQLDGNLLSKANGITITGVAAGATLIINVNGTAITMANFGTDALTPFQSTTIWNLFEATTVQVSGIAVRGTLLAFNADFANPSGVIWGQIFAKSFKSTGTCAQINLVPFTGLTSPTTVCGDGIIQGNEQCDLGQSNGSPSTCCTSTCQFVAANSTCRASAGTCDIPEVCSGMSANCPVDSFQPITQPCGSLFGICDVQLSQHCPGNGPLCNNPPPAPLWYWDAFNVLSFDSYTCNGGDIQGRLAARNNVALSHFTLGLEENNNDYFSATSLLVAGNATWTDGSVYPTPPNSLAGGYIAVGENFIAPDYLAAVKLNVYVTFTQFDTAQIYFSSLQTLLSQQPDTATVTTIFGDGLLITCQNPTSILNKFTVDGLVLSATNWYQTKNCLFSSGWIIDVTGTSNVVLQGSQFPGVVERIVYNVLGSGRTINGQTGVGGNILAPANTYYQFTGVTYGRLIVGNVTLARQNNKPNCINFQSVTITNKNLAAVGNTDTFIYVVDIANYVIGDLICFQGNCQKVIAGIIGDLNGDGVTDQVVQVSAPFGQTYPSGSTITTLISNPTATRTVLTPQIVSATTAASPVTLKPTTSDAVVNMMSLFVLCALLVLSL